MPDLDSTTFVSLFHTPEQEAQGVVQELIDAGVPSNVIYTLDRGLAGTGSAVAAHDADLNRYRVTLEELHVPARDINHLLKEIGNGGILIAVAFASSFTDRVEAIFERHAARKIDEAVITRNGSVNAGEGAAIESSSTTGSFGSRVYHPIVPGARSDEEPPR